MERLQIENVKCRGRSGFSRRAFAVWCMQKGQMVSVDDFCARCDYMGGLEVGSVSCSFVEGRPSRKRLTFEDWLCKRLEMLYKEGEN